MEWHDGRTTRSKDGGATRILHVVKDLELEPGKEIQSLRTQVSDVLKSK